MAFAIGAVIAGVSAGLGGGFLGFTGLTAGFLAFGSSLALNFISAALQPKPKSASFAGSSVRSDLITRQVRQPISYRRTIYGECRASGSVVFMDATGDNDQYLHMVIAVASHEVEEIGSVYINDSITELDANGWVVNGAFSGLRDRVPLEEWVSGFSNTDYRDTVIGAVTLEGTQAGTSITATIRWQTDTASRAHRIPAGWKVMFDGNPEVYTLTADAVMTAPSGNYVTITNTAVLQLDKSLPSTAGSKVITFYKSQTPVVRIYKRTGAAGQSAIADLVSAFPGVLDSNFRGDAVAYIYAMMEWERNTFYSGIPNISAFVKGKKDIYDPRTGTTGYSTNSILCERNYILDARLGLGESAALMNDTVAGAQANICDEMVATKSVAATVTMVDTAGDWFKLSDEIPFQHGDRVQLSITGTPPGGTSTGTNYFVRVHDWATRKIKLCTTLANANAGVCVNLTSAPTGGTLTITKNAEPRYTVNGWFDSDKTPFDVLNNFILSCAGALSFQDNCQLFAGAYQTPVLSLTDNDLLSGYEINTRQSLREKYNTVRGAFVSPQNFGQPSTYKEVKVASYVSADGRTLEKQIDLDFVSRDSACQRIARAFLEQNRREISLSATFGIKSLIATPNDHVTATFTPPGFSAKVFLVTNHNLKAVKGKGGKEGIGFELSLAETDAAVWNWNSSSDETASTPAARTSLASVFDPTAPTNVAAVSGTTTLYVRGDGTIGSRVYVSWTAPTGSVDRYEVQHGLINGALQPSFFVDDTQTGVYIYDVKDGETYDFRVRAVTAAKVPSAWAGVRHTVVGKQEPPADVASLSAQQNGEVVLFRWPQVSDLDVSGYEIRMSSQQGTPTWTGASPIKNTERGDELTTAIVPPGSWRFFIKAIDTSGNYSTNAAYVDATVAVSGNNIALPPGTSGASSAFPLWAGTKTGCFVHPVTYHLMPKSQTMSAGSADPFVDFCPNPVAVIEYEHTEIDLTGGVAQNVVNARVYSTMNAPIGGLDNGTPQTPFYLKTKDYAAGSYGAYAQWTQGRITGRWITGKVAMLPAPNTGGMPYLTDFAISSDVAPREVLFTNQAILVGGTAITYAQPFLSLPNVQISPRGSAARFPVRLSETVAGATIALQNSAGTDTGGNADIYVRGI